MLRDTREVVPEMFDDGDPSRHRRNTEIMGPVPCVVGVVYSLSSFPPSTNTTGSESLSPRTSEPRFSEYLPSRGPISCGSLE